MSVSVTADGWTLNGTAHFNGTTLAGILQLRHKGHWSRDIFAMAQQVARFCREAGQEAA